MNTIQFAMAIVDWLQADPSHIVVAASAIAAVIPTPDPATPWGKVYKVLDALALNILHAKETGTQPADVQKIAQEVAAILSTVNPAPVAPPAAQPVPASPVSVGIRPTP